MGFPEEYKKIIIQKGPPDFTTAALELFQYQAQHNPVYQAYLKHLKKDPAQVKELPQIPFLPIEFFKTHQVQSRPFTPQTIFKSSGTTLQQRSQHLVAHTDFYKKHAQNLFEETYGPLAGSVVLALLPSYLEQGDSSLVMMVDHFMQVSGQSQNGFFLQNHNDLRKAVQEAKASQKKVYLFGVTYALLDLAEEPGAQELSGITIFETGGMKGRRREMVREELHGILTKAFGATAIHSEYGMTELLSQAYSTGEGIFQPSRTLRVLVRDVNDPFTITDQAGSGGVNVIDLANVDSCAFIETKDLGKLYADGSFEVMGRFDNSDIRGCNLLVS
ncbi:acyl transferase [Rufibacter glacialis]|uniref:Acyl transferase n=1 Tax=Rufibacter glacialis TaxID=1259555 RepID=A0A5M8QA82_9BACT|nr:acyl transferase [Rufibacter glacialis]KAA6431770.1 acyl transferase [Rufibacter glacialis]GGK81696.1 acyltransferase [Rufibacter glacialis]